MLRGTLRAAGVAGAKRGEDGTEEGEVGLRGMVEYREGDAGEWKMYGGVSLGLNGEYEGER